ncbi:class I SAM-dependent methyltransferase [Tepidamorphus sp. 3E244]|uniref:class I SAM-dependent methyltransferase n=1 Tax=Tepidamorphus sp. 3E244 TaxID=3385498 RepID=UPI0038FC9E07
MRILASVLRRVFVRGELTIFDHDGSCHVFGNGEGGPRVAIRFQDRSVARTILLNPESGAAEAYMDGRLTLEPGSTIHDLIRLHSVNRNAFDHSTPMALVNGFNWLTRSLSQANSVHRAARNAKEHYDHPPEFYAMWLDREMNYSCAYFPKRNMSLEGAQLAKMRHIAAKLDIEPGMKVLEIGSGWGGLAVYLAEATGAQVTGISPVPHQIERARQRAADHGLSDRVTFVQTDYRELEGQFDRIVSVGMMEHVGQPYFREYFRTIGERLTPDGYALVHAIGYSGSPEPSSSFITKYIFPGGYIPSMSEVFEATQREGLWVADCELLRHHYGWTIRHWRERFEARRDEVVEMMGERFTRMWEVYLNAVEQTFYTGGHMVFQILVSHAADAVAFTRDYITERESSLRAANH